VLDADANPNDDRVHKPIEVPADGNVHVRERNAASHAYIY
jgi:hypothetical protein